MLKDGARGEIESERLLDLAGQPNRQQGVAARLKEIVLRTHLLGPQQLRPDAGQCLFHVRYWGDKVLPRLGRREVRRGKSLAIHLAIGREGEPIERDENRGHHVIGQLRLKEAAQF